LTAGAEVIPEVAALLAAGHDDAQDGCNELADPVALGAIAFLPPSDAVTQGPFGRRRAGALQALGQRGEELSSDVESLRG